ncbi:MAG: valine--tRNA ligase [Vicinamibacteria bacterium]|nr:valine--tRNA ligase [Vicinamibacteria bacterium]
MERETIDKSHSPQEISRHWYRFWEESGFFHADAASQRPPFSIVVPPPTNAGESFHVGHAFALTLQDVVVRWKRMCGFDVHCLPGLDHAVISAQTAVERQLAREGLRKEDIGRKAFQSRVSKWANESGGAILSRLRAMGYSLDWTRFDHDATISRSVREAFVSLHAAGLVYRDNGVVNWCSQCGTALSDLDVDSSETESGRLWFVRYLVADGDKRESIVVATTHPETILGDTAVAVHPADARHRGLVGRDVTLPVLERRIPVVADSAVDKDFGTGAVRVTPAHDPKDFLIARHLGLPCVNVMDERGILNENAGPYRGMDRLEARRGVVARLEQEGLLVSAIPRQISISRCRRCRAIVEPRLSLQWFVKTRALAEPAIVAMEEERVTFIPESWRKTSIEWMRNARDWCVSRQLYWGQRIPAWTCMACKTLIVAREDPARCPDCGAVNDILQDPDVLDTWFSSALSPYSSMGWPDKTADFARYYPNDVLMATPDAISWVSRMIMMGLRCVGDVPCRKVFVNGLARDERREKESNARGDAIDPLDLIEKHGADTLRFTLTALAAPGADPSPGEARLLGHRAFVNKLWNASRFVLLNLDGEIARPEELAGELSLPSRWILSLLQKVIARVQQSLQGYRFDLVAHELYHFVWRELCDWYIEMSKSLLAEGATAAKTRRVLIDVLDATLRLLHPVIPFVTEELWQKLPHDGASIMTAPFPLADASRVDDPAETEMGRLKQLIAGVRAIRSLYEVEPRKKIGVTVIARNRDDREFVERHRSPVLCLARVGRLDVVSANTERPHTIRHLAGDLELRIPMAGLFDIAAEMTRLSKERLMTASAIETLRKRLDNPQFVARARPEIVVEHRERWGALTTRMEKTEETLRELTGGRQSDGSVSLPEE